MKVRIGFSLRAAGVPAVLLEVVEAGGVGEIAVKGKRLTDLRTAAAGGDHE